MYRSSEFVNQIKLVVTNYEKNPYRTQTLIVHPNMGPDVAISDPLKIVFEVCYVYKDKIAESKLLCRHFSQS